MQLLNKFYDTHVFNIYTLLYHNKCPTNRCMANLPQMPSHFVIYTLGFFQKQKYTHRYNTLY